jgi:hypothetical protein
MRKVYRTLSRRLALAIGSKHPAVLDSVSIANDVASLPLQLMGKKRVGAPDFTFCHNVLERTEPSHLSAMLAKLAATGTKICFVISTRFSDQLDANGFNLHRTILAPEEWQAAIASHFPNAVRLNGIEHDSCLILTWKPGFLEKLAIGHADRRESLARRYERLSNAIARRVQKPQTTPLDASAIRALLKGKTVALVGNSRALAERDYGPEIDSSDIVIRCNRAPIMSRKSHGARTDWIATSIPFSPDLLTLKGASHVLWMSRRQERLPAWMLRFTGLYRHSPAEYGRLEKMVGSRPSTGFMVIELLLSSECTKLDLYGFDFFKSQSVSGDRTRTSAPHDFEGEEDYVRRWAEEDPRLTIHG